MSTRSVRPPLQQLWSMAKSLEGKTFGQLDKGLARSFSPRNKGRGGEFIEAMLGLPHSTRKLDFSDGELKTYASRRDGAPACARMAIGQLNGDDIDQLISAVRFEMTSIYEKTRRMILVGIHSEHPDPARWLVTSVRCIDASPGSIWNGRLAESYEEMRAAFTHRIVTGDPAQAHLTSAGTYMHICGKDQKPYRPAYSKKLGRQVTTRQIAAYLSPEFLRRVAVEHEARVDSYGGVVLDDVGRVLLVEPDNDAAQQPWTLPFRGVEGPHDPTVLLQGAVRQSAFVNACVIAEVPGVFDTPNASRSFFLMRVSSDAVAARRSRSSSTRSVCWATWDRAHALLDVTKNAHDRARDQRALVAARRCAASGR